MTWVQDIPQDVRFTLRLFAKERWFTVAAIGALALAIGVTSMMFTIINGYNLKGLPVDDPDRLLYLGTRTAAGREAGVSYPDYQDWRGASRSFAALEAFAPGTMTISDPGSSPDSLGGAFVSSGAFAILDEKPMLGRGFVESDDRIGAPPVVVLGHRLWVSRYGSDPAIIGRPVSVNGVAATVVGVMREGFEFPFREAVWQPLSQLKGIEKARRDDRMLGVFGPLADGVTPAQARAELGGIVAGLRKDHPDTNAGIELVAVRFGEQQVGRLGDQQPPLALFATAVFVLLIACANVANLLLARAAGRSREMAIRASVGATRWRIVRQLLVESLLLAFAAGALGLWLSRLGVGFIADAFGRNVPYWMRFTVDGRVLAFLVAVCFLCALVFGLAPALAASKTDVSGVMKEGGRTGIAPRTRRWTQSLVAAELALTVILLAAAGLMVRSFLVLYTGDRLIDASRVLTMGVELPGAKYPTPERRAAFYQRLDERLRVIPGLSLATIASNRPFVGAPARQVSVDGQPIAAGDKPRPVPTIAIGPRYFETLGLPVLRGRVFTDVDGMPGHDTAIVNQRFAETYFPAGNGLGARIRLAEDGTPLAEAPWLTIVGISPTVRQSMASAARPVVYVPLRSHSSASAAIIVGGLSEPASAAPVLRREVASLDADVTLFNARPLSDLLADTRLQPRLIGTVLGVFAAIALLLSMVGLYSVTAYAVLQRTHEIGVRMALGAQSRQVVWLFVRRGMVPLGIGLAIGLAGAFAAGQILRGLLIQTSATDPVTLVFVVSVLVVVAVAACFFPARRAARLNPLAVLRYD
jgi:putative ABC transport system permease protein